MSILRYDPWNVLNQFYRDLEKSQKGLATHEDNASTVATSNWAPAVDIKEVEDHFLIEADIPGVDAKDIEINMENGVLTLKGERHTESTKEEKNYKRIERTYGSFYRRFGLPDTADAEKISAQCKNGVLAITIPKKEVAKPRKIEVKINE